MKIKILAALLLSLILPLTSLTTTVYAAYPTITAPQNFTNGTPPMCYSVASQLGRSYTPQARQDLTTIATQQRAAFNPQTQMDRAQLLKDMSIAGKVHYVSAIRALQKDADSTALRSVPIDATGDNIYRERVTLFFVGGDTMTPPLFASPSSRLFYTNNNILNQGHSIQRLESADNVQISMDGETKSFGEWFYNDDTYSTSAVGFWTQMPVNDQFGLIVDPAYTSYNGQTYRSQVNELRLSPAGNTYSYITKAGTYSPSAPVAGAIDADLETVDLFGDGSAETFHDTCIDSTQSMDTTGFSQYSESNSDWPEPQVWDDCNQGIVEQFSCFISKIGESFASLFEWIGSFFTAFSDAITNALVAIFVPTSETMNVLFNDLISFFDQKFGFLAYPFVFIVEFLTEIGGSNATGNFANCSSGSATSTSGSFSFGNFFGSNVTFNPCGFQRIIGNTAFDWFRLLLQASTLFILLAMLLRRYKEVTT